MILASSGTRVLRRLDIPAKTRLPGCEMDCDEHDHSLALSQLAKAVMRSQFRLMISFEITATLADL